MASSWGGGMTQYATRSVVSGRAYPVVQLGEGEPVSLDAFVGDQRFVLDLDGDPYLVAGCGRRVGEEVRFYQKDHDGQGRDIRIWAVRPAAGGWFLVEHVVH
jgi:hypothetical protein